MACDKNLNSKVKNDVSQRKNEKRLLHELDLTTFKKFLETFLANYKNEAFITYCNEYYVSREEKWVYCHRKGLKVNTNMKLERWHRQIKYEEAGGLVMKRLDKSLNHNLKSSDQKAYESPYFN